jgi:hypothetical protein
MGHERVIRYKAMPAREQPALSATPFNRYVFDDGTVWTEFYRSDEGYLLRFPGLADFEVSADGTEVIAHPAEGADEVTVEHLYINQLVPLALSRQGRPAFHASVVTVPGGAVAFLGKTGMGKSTLAASFALQDAEFLTDDALLIEESAKGCLAMPSHASVRLWKDSVEALVGDDVRTASAISYSDKARLLAGDALRHSDEPQALLAAYILGNEDVPEVSIETLTGLDRYMGWIGNSFLLDIEDNELLAQHFEWTHRISGTVPTFALNYPRDYGILPSVRDTVRRHVAGIRNEHAA